MQGIYIIRCTQEETVYIGSSNDIKRRWMEHRRDLNTEKHHNKQLQTSWDAYGNESFIFEILEETEDLVQREQFWLTKYANNCYNASTVASNPMANPEIVKRQLEALRASGKRGKQILTEEQAIMIKQELVRGVLTTKQLADTFSVSISTIASIRRGDRWAHVLVEGFVPGRKVKSVDKKEEIKSMYEAGVPIAEIANKLQLRSTSSIYYALSKV